MTPRLLPLVLLAFAACSPAPARTMPGPLAGAPVSSAPVRITAPGVPSLEGIPQAVRVGFTVYVSGMVPVDSAGSIVGSGDLAAQTRQLLVNLDAVVRAAHGVPGDVVKVTLYLKDATPESISTARAALLDGLDKLTPPALTVVGVAALPEPSMRVMLDATAVLRSEFPDRTRAGAAGRGRGR
ncbi:MAG: RidA family protein [Gemmatimonadales bacterium]